MAKKKEKKVRIPMRIKEIMSETTLKVKFSKLDKADLVREFESRKANKDGCYCNPGGGGC